MVEAIFLNIQPGHSYFYTEKRITGKEALSMNFCEKIRKWNIYGLHWIETGDMYMRSLVLRRVVLCSFLIYRGEENKEEQAE